MILVFTYNFPGLIEDSNPELLLSESESLTTASCVFHIYNYNYSSSNSVSQPNKNIAFLDFITNYVKVSLQITSVLLQVTTKFIKHKLRQLKLPQIIDDYYKLRQFLLQITTNIIANCAGITKCGVSTNYVVTTSLIYS